VQSIQDDMVGSYNDVVEVVHPYDDMECDDVADFYW
jgi:hypothetical protein